MKNSIYLNGAFTTITLFYFDIMINLQCWLNQSMFFFFFRVLQVRMVVQAQRGPLETEALQEPWGIQVPKASM